MSIAMPDWTDLLPELLALIASKLHPFDCSQFRAACPAFAAACPVPCLAPKVPFLLFPGPPGERSTFLSIGDNNHYRARLPGRHEGKYCVGSHNEWLVTLDPFSEPTLVNPITGQEVRLPSLATLPFIRHVHGSDGSITSIFHRDSDGDWSEYTPRRFSGISIDRAVLSSFPGSEGGFIIAALLEATGRLIWTKSGEEKWYGPEGSEFRFREIGFHKGQLYGVGYGLYHIRLDDGACGVAELICQDVGRPMRYLHIYLFTDHECGDLMLAWRDYSYDSIRAKTDCVDIVRFDAGRRAWVAVKGLGNRALFVGIGAPVLVSAEEDGVKGNCVYFNDDWWDLMFADEHRAAAERDIGIYHLRDGRMERFHYPPHPRYNWPAPVWISTMLPLGLDNFEVEREELRWESSRLQTN